MSDTVTWSPAALRGLQRRTLRTLVLAQAMGGLAITIGVTVAAIMAEEITGSERLAGLVQSMQVIGAAFASYLLARLMGRRGRRVGLGLGYLIGATGAGLNVVAGTIGSFPLLLVGATMLGAVIATNSQSRYAATDLAAPEHRARALSLVVWATTIGAVAGPNLTGLAGRLAAVLGIPPYAGAFLCAAVGILVAGLVLTVLLRPDPLLVAREVAGAEAVRPASAPGTRWAVVVDIVRTRPAVASGIAALALAHAVMIAVMVMTPLHMHHGGATLEVIGFVISGHVLGMFALSPVVGWGADRFGRGPVILLGAGLLLASLLLSGTSPEGSSWEIAVGLFLLGLGWSCCTVAASTLLSESSPLHARTDVQGAADLVMGLVAAAAGACAGLVMAWLGFGALTYFAMLLVAGAGAAGVAARRSERRAAAPEESGRPIG